MKTTRFVSRGVGVFILLTALAQSVAYCDRPPSIDGTYELTERVMANGTVLRPPLITALYTVAGGRFSLNLFVKNSDGTVASESSVGRYTFSADKYCEWIEYTTRKDLDKPGVTNEAPTVCARNREGWSLQFFAAGRRCGGQFRSRRIYREDWR
jgi:hypothetical protein